MNLHRNVSVLILMFVSFLSCRHSSENKLSGGRTGDPATFRNSELLDAPPDYERLVKPFLLELKRTEPTLARVMIEFVEAEDTSFFKTSEKKLHNGEEARAFIVYPRQILFFAYYFDVKSTDLDKLSVWLHELLHLVIYKAQTAYGETYDTDDENIVVPIEQELIRVYKAWASKDKEKQISKLALIRQKLLQPYLPRLAAIAVPSKDVGEFKAIPIFKDNKELTYPVPNSVVDDSETLAPNNFEININRLWSFETIDVGNPHKEFNSEKTIATSQLANGEFDSHPIWESGLGFPQPKELIYLRGLTNIGYPIEARTISMSRLSEDFKTYVRKLKKYLGISWIRTLYRNFRTFDGSTKPSAAKVPACGNRTCRDVIIFFTE